MRLSLFLIAGVYADLPLLLLALCLLPMMAVGLYLGRRLTLNMSRDTFVRLVTWLVLASGIALIGRYLSEVNWHL
ncbi:Sulfite exporter TauE/SafE [compost metagenome]